MSTRAQVDMMHRNKKTYRFWIYRDGYPTGVAPILIQNPGNAENYSSAAPLRKRSKDSRITEGFE